MTPNKMRLKDVRQWRRITFSGLPIAHKSKQNQISFFESGRHFETFYAIPVLYKKLSQSLRVSPEYSFDWKFLKVGSVIV